MFYLQMGVYRGVFPHFEVFTGGAQDHLLEDETSNKGVKGEVGESHNPGEDAGHKEAWK